MITIGSIEAAKAYVGGVEVAKAYVGAEQIYPSAIVPVQIVRNGNFASGFDYWNSHAYCDRSEQDGFIRITKNPMGSYGAILYENPTWVALSTSHKYYQKAIMRQGTTSANAGFHSNAYAVASNSILSTTNTSWQTKDQITSPKADNNYICLRAGNSSAALNTYADFKSFMIIDLTLTFGAGNEPTLAECRTLFPDDYYPFNV